MYKLLTAVVATLLATTAIAKTGVTQNWGDGDSTTSYSDGSSSSTKTYGDTTETTTHDADDMSDRFSAATPNSFSGE